jgi:hypothetical protein
VRSVAVISLVVAATAHAAPRQPPPADEPEPQTPPGDLPLTAVAVPVLDHRFTIDLPEAMDPEDLRGRHRRSGPPPIATRAELLVEGGRFVMEAYETFTNMHDTDFRDGVLADLHRQGADGALIAWLKVEQPVRAYAVTPPVPERVDAGNLVHAAYVAGKDGAVAIVGFYVLGDARIEAAEWARLAQRIATTLAPGYRTFAIPSSTGSIWLDGHQFELTAPSDWAVQVADATLRLRAIVPLGHSPTECVVDYADPAPAAAASEPGVMLYAPVQWRRWGDARGVHARMQLELQDRFVLHIACSAGTARELEAARAIVGQLVQRER